MKRNDISKVCFVATAVSAIIFSASALADTVVLKSGNIVEGAVTGKTDIYLAILPADSNGVKTYYLAETVDKVNGQLFRKFRLPKDKIPGQKFRRQKGQKYSVVSLTLKDGRTVKGQLVERTDEFFRVIPEGSGLAEEFLIETIAQAE
jgi:hypothetical protein